MGESPVVYSLTKEGIEVDLNAEEGWFYIKFFI
jgi:hypothetical protein